MPLEDSYAVADFRFRQGKQLWLFFIPLNSKIEQATKSCVFMWIDPGSHTHWSQFQGTPWQPDHVRVEGSNCYSPKWILTHDTRLVFVQYRTIYLNWEVYKNHIVYEEIS